MRVLVIIVLLTKVCGTAMAQIPVRLYFNQNWQLCKKDAAAYYRDAKFDTTKYQYVGTVEDYTVSGKLVMKGFYEGKERNGEFTFYYENGTIESVGLYSRDIRFSSWKYFYPDGTKKTEVEYFPPNKYNIKFFNDSSGREVLKNGTGKWKERYEYLDASPPLFVINEGSYKNGRKDGKWTCRIEGGKQVYEETYRNGEFFGGYNFDSNGKKADSFNQPFKNHMNMPQKFALTENLIFVKGVNQSDYPFLKKLPDPNAPDKNANLDSDKVLNEIFSVVEQSAAPPGGMGAFYKFIAEHIKYPSDARKKGIQGRVFVEFIIYKDGALGEFKVIKGIGGGCDEEAVRVVEEYASQFLWEPGRQRGKPVKQRYTLPIIFRIG
jgi:TonB family protein